MLTLNWDERQEIKVSFLKANWYGVDNRLNLWQCRASQYKYVKVVIRIQMTDRSKWYGATVMEANRKGQEELSKNVGANALAQFFPSVFVTSMTALFYLHHCLKLIFPFHSQHPHLSYSHWITIISSLLDFLVWADAVISQIVICYSKKHTAYEMCPSKGKQNPGHFLK